jgi:hypothetical protein
MHVGKAHLGRNDPCHCGSGKKYKKCCLAADEEAALHPHSVEPGTEPQDENAILEVEEGDATQADDVEDWEGEDEDEGDGEDDGTPSSWSDAPWRQYPQPPPIPKATLEEDAVVDAWWKRFMPVYRAMDLDAMHALLDAFFAAHPDLVPHLYLHQECLLEWEAAMCRAGRWTELIDRLLRLRRDFPLVYDQVFQYLDNTLAVALLASGRAAELSNVLDRFAAYPDTDPDYLAKLLNVLLAANRQEDVFALAQATTMPSSCPGQVVGYGPGLHWLFCQAAVPIYEQRSGSDAAADDLVQTYDALHLPWPHGVTPAQAKTTLEHAFAPLDWAALGATRRGADKAARLCSHFWVWLHDTQGMSWATAAFFAERMRELYADTSLRSAVLRRPFALTEEALEAFICETHQDSMALNGTRALAFLQAMWFYTDFLVAMGAHPTGAAEPLRQTCRRLYAKLLKAVDATDAGPYLFARFPEYAYRDAQSARTGTPTTRPCGTPNE